MLEKRIIDLETKFTFQEDLVDELNKIVTKQQFTIEKLLKEVKSLKTAAAEEGHGETGDLKDEVPPHY